MPGWKDEYLSSLLEAERNNPVNFELVEACASISLSLFLSRFRVPTASAAIKSSDTKSKYAGSDLNDRITALEAEKAQWQTTFSKTTAAATSEPQTAEPSTDDSSTNNNDPHLLRLRTDLATTLRQKSALETRLRKTTTEVTHLRSQSKSQARQLQSLATERDGLRVKVRDQSEELRIKKQMLEQVQDDVLALEMQLNVAEQQKAKIAAENKQLIERWMRRVREEADNMNAANERGL